MNDLLVLTNGKVIAAAGDDWPSMEVGRMADLDTPNVAAAIHSWELRTGVPGNVSTEHRSQVEFLVRSHRAV